MTIYYYPELAEMLRRLVAERRAEILQIEHTFLAGYVDVCAGIPGVRTVLSLHNLGFLQYARMAATARWAEWPEAMGKALLMRTWEARWASRFDRCVTVSKTEAQLLRGSGCEAEIRVVENGVDCDGMPMLPACGTADMLFVGVIGYPPNADAVEYFCQRILPRIRAQVPEARLYVVGQAPPERIRRLAGEAVIVTGEVADTRPWYERCRVSVVPLRSGGGMRLKIPEAMALGRPVVSTPIGAEGMEAVRGEELLEESEPEAFAAAVVRLLREDDFWQRVRERARARVEADYSWRLLGKRMYGVYEELREENAIHACDR
jgi:polysaccharide biosynthesis protein PslH